MLYPTDELVNLLPGRHREQRQRGALQRGVADLHDPLVRQIGNQADPACMIEIYVPGESAREVKNIQI